MRYIAFKGISILIDFEYWIAGKKNPPEGREKSRPIIEMSKINHILRSTLWLSVSNIIAR